MRRCQRPIRNAHLMSAPVHRVQCASRQEEAGGEDNIKSHGYRTCKATADLARDARGAFRPGDNASTRTDPWSAWKPVKPSFTVECLSALDVES